MSTKPGQTTLPVTSRTSAPAGAARPPAAAPPPPPARPGPPRARRPGGPPEPRADARDPALGEQHVLHGVHAVRRIDDAAAPEQQAHAPSPPLLPAGRGRTPIRTATPFVTWARITGDG